MTVQTRVGQGFDIHRFVDGPSDRFLVLGGVTFAGERALVGHSDADVIAQRVETLSSLADEMVSLRAQARIGETVRVLIEDEQLQEGRAAHQGPEVDGTTTFIGTEFKVGQYVDAVVIDSMGADLVAKPL